MDQRTPPTVGIVVSLSLVAVVCLPYVALSPAAAAGVPVYYDQGVVGPWGAALLALVATVALAGGRQGRTPPDTAAGAALALTVVATLVAAEWALAVDPAIVQQLGAADWLSAHRPALVAVAALDAAVAAWYAAALDLV